MRTLKPAILGLVLLAAVLMLFSWELAAMGLPARRTSSDSHSFLPLVASQTTPTPTLRPHQGIKLDYTVVVSQPLALSVTLTARDIGSASLALYRLASPTLDSLPPLTHIKVTDETGVALDHELSTWEGAADRHYQELVVEMLSTSSILIDYSLDLASQIEWQADAQSVAISENLPFFQPRADRIDIGEMRFRFSLPEGWRVATRLTPSGDTFYANLDDTFRVFAQDGWWRLVLGGPMVLGEFEVTETRFGDIRALAAYPRGDVLYASDAGYVAQMYAYSRSIMGDQSHMLGDIAFLFVFGPKKASPEPIYALSTRGTFEEQHVNEGRHLGHEMQHMWLGCGNSLPDARRFLWIPCWFMEGTIEFLGLEAHLTTGAFGPEKADEFRVDWYREYKAVLLDTGNDVPLSECLTLTGQDFYACQYRKAHSVMWLMDQVLRELTNGTTGVEELTGHLFRTYAVDPEHQVTTGEILMAASELCAHDFQPFFDAYVLGTDPLPIAVEDGKLVVLWDQLSWML